MCCIPWVYKELDMTEQLNLSELIPSEPASQVALVVKNPFAIAGATEDVGSILNGRIPWWRKARQLTPVFLPRESHGQRSLAS